MVSLNAIQRLKTSKKLIIKIGSQLLVSSGNDSLRTSWMKSLAADIAKLRANNCQVILVSSGAVALGRQSMDIHGRALRLEEKQALAAIGQMQLAQAWAQVFASLQIKVGQVLLTIDDTQNRRRWLNSSSTLNNLLQMGVLPLINENDSVASDEIRFGDNDQLAGRAAQMVGADMLILLSDVDGLYSQDPSTSQNAQHIAQVDKITTEIKQMGANSSNQLGSGGMKTKILAAKIAGAAGCATIIADGQKDTPISLLLAGAKCTVFLPHIKPAQARKNWIAGTVQPKGKLIIDDGAVKALTDGASLLAAGIVDLSGKFERGEIVSICCMKNREIARGLAAYSLSEINQIKGLRSDQITAVLGYEPRKAVVHRDNLVLLEK
ncbi:MAG: glutamate 5-kinase [Robiginitomaculum sp.]|nr:glutamate 5-kinase [Robiginitomaculum sp.]